MSPIDEKSLKVLMIGKGDACHLEPLARCIKRACPEIQLEVQGLRETTTDGARNYPKSSTVFDAVHQFPWSVDGKRPKHKSPKKKPVKHTSKLNPIWMQCAGFFCRSVFSGISSKYARHFESLLNGVDVIHLQSLFHKPALRWLISNNPNIPIVASCWGSEVLRQGDLFRTLHQQQLLRFASAITMTGNEYKEVVLSKYGRKLLPKIYETFFNPQVEGFSDSNRSEASQRFQARWNVPTDRTIICVSHNGHLGGQHLDLIESIAKIDENKKDPLFFVAPMTYGASEEYQDLISSTLTEKGLSGIVLKEFLTEDELKDLRLATDILIYAPISDAFSVSVSQALAAGSVAILGSWLPYKTRRRAGFKYWEIDSPGEAGQMLNEILEDWPKAKLQSEPNRKLSAEFFCPERIGQQWIDVYKSAIQNFRKKSPSQSD